MTDIICTKIINSSKFGIKKDKLIELRKYILDHESEFPEYNIDTESWYNRKQKWSDYEFTEIDHINYCGEGSGLCEYEFESLKRILSYTSGSADVVTIDFEGGYNGYRTVDGIVTRHSVKLVLVSSASP